MIRPDPRGSLQRNSAPQAPYLVERGLAAPPQERGLVAPLQEPSPRSGPRVLAEDSSPSCEGKNFTPSK